MMVLVSSSGSSSSSSLSSSLSSSSSSLSRSSTRSSSSSSSISIRSSSSSRSSVSRSRRLGGESNREIVFVSFVRACVRSCVCLRGTMLLPIAGVADVRKYSVCVPVPFPLCRNVKVIEKLF